MSDLFQTLLRLVDQWEARQTRLKSNAIETVEVFSATTERDADGRRTSPELDRLNAESDRLAAEAMLIVEAKLFAAELLAHELGGEWSRQAVAWSLEARDSSARDSLEMAIEQLPKPWHAFVLEQLRKRYPEQLAAIEAKHRDDVPITQPPTAEQATPQTLANDCEETARKKKPGKKHPAIWPEILTFLHELMDTGRPCPTYAAIQRRFNCGSTPVTTALEEGQKDEAFLRWRVLGQDSTIQPEFEVLPDPELLKTFNEYAGTKKLSSDVRAESWESIRKTTKKKQRELIDLMKKELSRSDE